MGLREKGKIIRVGDEVGLTKRSKERPVFGELSPRLLFGAIRTLNRLAAS